ncbi:MAG TPA: hypothetical protein VI756_07095 [Blastocatellia bacterium]
MRIEPLTVLCPKCGSGNIAYSCEPECCFNHVCGDCLANFQLVTRDLGQRITGRTLMAAGSEPEADSCAPTAACAKCQSLKVRSLTDGESGSNRAVCLKCGSVLELAIEREGADSGIRK